ncbi:MAG: hypothetical protein ACHQ50_11910 [Fimbriimonadales bacterium]
MNRIRLSLATVSCLCVASFANAQPQHQTTQDKPRILAQRNDPPPSWSVGAWTGHSDYLHADVELRIGDDGRSTFIVRGGRANTRQGWFRSGRLEFDRDRYLIRQAGHDLGLTRESNRDDTVVLHRMDERRDRQEDLTITGPQNNERVRSGPVTLQGSSAFSEVRIEIFRGKDRIQSGVARTSSNGRFEMRYGLPPGKYEAVLRAGDRNRTVEKRVTFNIGGMGRTYIEYPAAGARLQGGPLTITGTSEAPDVEVEIYRGRDRVFIEQVPVRNGRFTSHTNLGFGSYVMTARGKENGETIGTDKRGFEVLDTARPGSSELRLDRPADRSRFRGPTTNIDGSAGGTQVRIQVFRGRDRIYNELVDVKEGHFHARLDLDQGHYDLTVMSEDRGRVLATRRLSIDVD